ncbi:B9 domain-containing protein 1 [Paraphysoderma sedebokerense]|nr:B9 domain-containing protein 1 [Paraphysoderma sedebokerense]KAI9139063.1 B9 domain-containing protein 1 [Paraphysoderma sedebokerense]
MSTFSVIVSGEIQSAYIPGCDNLYCKSSYVYGPDWSVISGIEQTITQLSRSSPSHALGTAISTSSITTLTHPDTIVWNCPLEIAFKSTNIFKWPQIVVSVYGLDGLGRDVIRGYGSVRLPITSGLHTLYVPLFVPIATSPFNQFISWITGRLPEFIDSKFVARSEGREVTRVQSSGTVKIVVNVVTKDMEKFGYTVSNSNTWYPRMGSGQRYSSAA